MGLISRFLHRSKSVRDSTKSKPSTANSRLSSYAAAPPPIQFDSVQRTILPIEIWRRILSLACRLPGSLSFEAPDPFISGSPLVLTDEEKAENTRHKIDVQLVCRAWRVICLEFSYESLVVCCRKHTLPLLNTLEGSKAEDPDARGHGWWTREIKFEIGSCPDIPVTSGGPNMNAIVVRILRCTPNLAIYLNNNGFGKALGKHTHPTIMNALGRHCGLSLRRLEWSASESPRWDDLEVLLFETPRLRTLSVLHMIQTPTPHPRKPLTLKYLHSLSLGPFPTPIGVKIPTWDTVLAAFTQTPSPDELQLPSLTSLSITPINFVIPKSSTERFFLYYGPHLRTLRTSDLTPRDLFDSAFVAPGSSNPSLRTILNLSPHLRSLVFNPLQPIAYPTEHACLERVAVYPPSEHPVSVPLRMYASQVQLPLDTLFEQLVGGAFPSLKVVRLRDQGAFGFLGRTTEWLEQWRKQWDEKGIRFENRDGLSYAFTLDLMEMLPDDV
ncbi:hypothetical protein BD410DRAFT_467733 [Rickenella mellea]|uniref:F-box domain-containing protein n=1 Tax=Rickenella mellea TaxID=50990 RepID=A0A4Y7PTP9_9AGAM|nr:hypothetical protein BD410DRAFT_467733 [Rickenella mellea]